ncbi:protein TolR [Cohaesibacter celericrescens]|uniref:Protein TolR n=1 Tax=Cohaesibacter celericrescens TaxID=2067669 RepID=A0A2N5XL35_9HYPH|nr:protein TolR [Cohaesibacter celericrescens]PLW75219.1 protein TolR [Cohaesibacter celericrescens]
MGMGSMGSPGGSRRRGARRAMRHRPVAEINVTPLVDVMLVLLIIFMVSAPMMTVGVPLDLPETTAKPLSSQTEPLTLSIKKDGSIHLQDQPVEFDALVQTLLGVAQNGYDERIFVRGDRDVDYGSIMKVMGAMNRAGFKKIGLVSTEELQ